jgi:uncharacterized FlaG/YvyC family protein
MASIPKLNDFNTNRQDLMKIKTLEDEIILFTKAEARDALIQYIDEELDFMTTGLTKLKVKEIEDAVNKRLDNFERSLKDHIDNKINSITEKIIEVSTTNIIEQRVNERLTEKLEKLKKVL